MRSGQSIKRVPLYAQVMIATAHKPLQRELENASKRGHVFFAVSKVKHAALNKGEQSFLIKTINVNGLAQLCSWCPALDDRNLRIIYPQPKKRKSVAKRASR